MLKSLDLAAVSPPTRSDLLVEIGKKLQELAGSFCGGDWSQALALISALSIIGFAFLVIVMVALFVPQLGAISAAVEKQFWKSLLFGLLAALLFVPVTLALVLSLVGIVLIPVWFVIFAAAVLFGYIAASQLVGKKVLHALRVKNKPMVVEALLGVLIISLVSFAPLVGGLVKIILCSAGLGAAALTRFGTSQG